MSMSTYRVPRRRKWWRFWRRAEDSKCLSPTKIMDSGPRKLPYAAENLYVFSTRLRKMYGSLRSAQKQAPCIRARVSAGDQHLIHANPWDLENSGSSLLKTQVSGPSTTISIKGNRESYASRYAKRYEVRTVGVCIERRDARNVRRSAYCSRR